MGMLGSADDIPIAPRRAADSFEKETNKNETIPVNPDIITGLKSREKSEKEKNDEREQKYENAQDAQKRLRRLRERQKKEHREILNVVLSVDEKKRLEKMARKYDITQRALAALAVSYFMDAVEKSDE